MEQSLLQYRIFYHVARSGNISRASNELYISQPAISKAIKKLEASLSVSLFHRSSRGVTLTEEGKLLFTHVERAFSSLSQGEELLRQRLELGIGHLTIGVSATLCKYVLLPYLKTFIKEYPHIQISILSQSSAQTIRQLSNHQADIGLVGTTQIPTEGTYYPLSKIHYTFVASHAYIKNLKLRKIETFPDLLSKGNVMLLDRNNISRQFIDNYLKEQNIRIANPLEVNNMDLLVEFARIGMGIGCVIREFIEHDLETGRLMELTPLCAIPSRSIGFLTKQDLSYNPSVEKFLSLLPHTKRSPNESKNSK